MELVERCSFLTDIVGNEDFHCINNEKKLDLFVFGGLRVPLKYRLKSLMLTVKLFCMSLSLVDFNALFWDAI